MLLHERFYSFLLCTSVVVDIFWNIGFESFPLLTSKSVDAINHNMSLETES